MVKTNENRKGYKKTQLGWIPEEWNCDIFSNYAEFKNGLNFSKEEKGSGYKIIGVGDFQDNHSIVYDNLEKVNLANGISDSYFLQENDLLFVRSNGNKNLVGRVLFLKNVKDFITHSGFTIRSRINSTNAYPLFCSYLFKSKLVKNQYLKLGGGTNISNLSQDTLSSVRIILPPLPEQRAIATCLTSWDKAITATQKLIEQKQLKKKWLMQNLLTGKKRLKGFEKTIWEKQPLSNFIKLISREIDKPNKPYLGIGIRSHGKGTFLKPNEQPEKNSMDKFYIVRQNDLIVNITFAWEQAIAIVKPEDDGALASHRFPTFTFIDKKGHPDFFRFFILQPRMKYMLQLISPGGAGRNRVMNKTDFIKLEFLLPDYKEQTAIAQILQTADKEIELLQSKLERLREQKKGLMQVLLTGKKRLKI